jgi:hypothetical protein
LKEDDIQEGSYIIYDLFVGKIDYNVCGKRGRVLYGPNMAPPLRSISPNHQMESKPTPSSISNVT